jgi:hypothetical protein
MNRQNSKWMLLAFAVIAVLLVQPLRAEMLEKTMTAGGMTVWCRLEWANGHF